MDMKGAGDGDSDGATSIPVSPKIPWAFPEPRTLAYLLGQDILVHPVVFDQRNGSSNNNSSGGGNGGADAVVRIDFPALSDVIPDTTVPSPQDTVWLDWWQPTNPAKAHAAGETIVRVVPISSFPVYVRKGAFIPLHPVTLLSGGVATPASTEEQLLDATSSVATDRVLFTWFAPSTAVDAAHPVQFALRESITEGTGMVATAAFSATNTITATISAHTQGSMGGGFSFVGVSKPSDVAVEAWPDSRCAHEYADHTSTLTVSCASLAGGLKVTLSGVAGTL